MNETFEKKKIAAELWKDHGSFAWSQVRAVPFIQAVILAGAYAVWKDGNNIIAAGLLIFGGVILLGIFFLLHRHWQHVDAFRDAADDLVPYPIKKPLLGEKRGKSKNVALSLVVLLCVINFIAGVYIVCPGYSYEKTSIDQKCFSESDKNEKS